ncbi:MAG TPA: MBL fold metallo-hydrolase [Patescibacteria group bacterium]|jgi:L-ascorbate metabolism protein UlaG (beta-lactamase superfamily)
MTITYHGHSCFKLRGKTGSVVTDPYGDDVGFSLPSLSADLVTVSHDHHDHNQAHKIGGTARRNNPFIINQLGEYEVGGISVFGVKSFHDDQQGVERGANSIFTIAIDGVRVCHLGDLGHELTEEQVKQIGIIDVLLVPVGGIFTLNAKQAVAVTRALEPSFVIPMHYNTMEHNQEMFGQLQPVEDFLKEFGVDNVTKVDKLKIESDRLPEEIEVVVLEKT